MDNKHKSTTVSQDCLGRNSIQKYCTVWLFVAAALLVHCSAGLILVPNNSFETPTVTPVSPYAAPDIDDWQKAPQPSWYDPSQNSNTPWAYLMGEFYNVSFPGQFIDNCDGNQAAFLFALPGAALFQDYTSVDGTNTVPTHDFNSKFNLGSSYDLTVGVLGGGGGMKPGVTLQLQLYYRDALSNMLVAAAATITNDPTVFPTNTHFVDFMAHLPAVQASDPWVGRQIGIQLVSTVGLDLAGGYWDMDNVRLVEIGTPVLATSGVSNGIISFAVKSGTGAQFEIQTATSVDASARWVSLASFTNVTGTVSFQDSITNIARFYRAKRL